MATVVLDYDDARDGELPAICMCCGEPSTRKRKRTFSWCPRWVGVLILTGLLPYAIVAIILTKRMTVPVPLCDQHDNHWTWRLLVTLFSFVGLLLVGVAGGFLIAEFTDRRQQDTVIPIFIFSMIGLLIAWIFVAVIIQNSAIRPIEITKDDITLTSVSQEFRDAYREQSEQREREYRRLRQQRRERNQRRDDDERIQPE